MWECKNCFVKRENPLFSSRKMGLCGKCRNPNLQDLPKFTLNATHMVYCSNCEIIGECIPGQLDPKTNRYNIRCIFCEELVEVRRFV